MTPKDFSDGLGAGRRRVRFTVATHVIVPADGICIIASFENRWLGVADPVTGRLSLRGEGPSLKGGHIEDAEVALAVYD